MGSRSRASLDPAHCTGHPLALAPGSFCPVPVVADIPISSTPTQLSHATLISDGFGTAIAMVLFCFGGHATLPSLHNQMQVCASPSGPRPPPRVRFRCCRPHRSPPLLKSFHPSPPRSFLTPHTPRPRAVRSVKPRRIGHTSNHRPTRCTHNLLNPPLYPYPHCSSPLQPIPIPPPAPHSSPGPSG